MGVSGHFGTESDTWRLDMAQNVCKFCNFFVQIFGLKISQYCQIVYHSSLFFPIKNFFYKQLSTQAKYVAQYVCPYHIDTLWSLPNENGTDKD